MSILFVLLMFLLIISVRYFMEPKPAAEPEIVIKPHAPLVRRELGSDIPQGYCFHLAHTWVLKEGTGDARVGVDKFVANLMGKIDHIDVRAADCWVRQGQKLITLSGGGTTLDLLSPVEGVANFDAVSQRSLVGRDRDASTVRRGLGCIKQQVHQYLGKLIRIDLNEWKIIGNSVFDDLAAQHRLALEEAERISKQATQAQFAQDQWAGTSVINQPM